MRHLFALGFGLLFSSSSVGCASATADDAEQSAAAATAGAPAEEGFEALKDRVLLAKKTVPPTPRAGINIGAASHKGVTLACRLIVDKHADPVENDEYYRLSYPERTEAGLRLPLSQWVEGRPYNFAVGEITCTAPKDAAIGVAHVKQAIASTFAVTDIVAPRQDDGGPPGNFE